MRTRIKYCGFTSTEDVTAAVEAGADAIGFNLFPQSSRFVDIDHCERLLEAVPAFVTTVGLVVNPDDDYLKEIGERLAFDLLQFHGEECEALCTSYGRPYIKAIRVATTADIEEHAYNFTSAKALMLDAKVEGEWGGTGQQFDWRLARDLPQPVILAGGLTPENVGDAMRIARPWAVDVSSGIERDKGVKDKRKMEAFAAAVAAADGVTNE